MSSHMHTRTFELPHPSSGSETRVRLLQWHRADPCSGSETRAESRWILFNQPAVVRASRGSCWERWGCRSTDLFVLMSAEASSTTSESTTVRTSLPPLRLFAEAAAAPPPPEIPAKESIGYISAVDEAGAFLRACTPACGL
jgi:hypothetical protein